MSCGPTQSAPSRSPSSRAASMSDLLGFILSGLVSGALYALLATGLVLSYSASGLFNFAHGATAYVLALAFYEFHSGFGLPAVPTALFLVCVVAPALGW